MIKKIPGTVWEPGISEKVDKSYLKENPRPVVITLYWALV